MSNHRHHGKYKSRTPRGFIVYKKRPKHAHTLTKENRSIFQNLDKKPYEVGGYMDFNNKGLERADVYIGSEGSVDIDMTPDKEVEYHTHPQQHTLIDKANYLPTEDDLKSFKESPSQAMIIFHEGSATITSKKGKPKINEKMLRNIETGLRRDIKKDTVSELFHKYVPKYKKMNFDVNLIPQTEEINLPIKVVEPRGKRKLIKR